MDLKSWLIWLMGLVKSSLWYTCAHVEQEVWLVVWTCSIGDYCFSLFLSWRHPTPCRHSFCIWRWNCFTQPWIAGIHLIVTTNFKMCLFKFRNLDTKIILKIWFSLLFDLVHISHQLEKVSLYIIQNIPFRFTFLVIRVLLLFDCTPSSPSPGLDATKSTNLNG